jgi:hypothetical protein
MSVPLYSMADAVKLAAPDRPFKIDPEEGGYDALVMLDGGPKPTLAEIEAAWDARPAPSPNPTNRQLILWLLRDKTPEELATIFEEAALL